MTCSDASSELSKFLTDYGVHEVPLSDSDMGEMGSSDPFMEFMLPVARHQNQHSLDLPAPQPAPSLQSALMPQASPASWVENLPPKKSPEAAVNDFKVNYPGKLLDEDTMPSIRLLSLVQHSLKPGEKIRWIPWQFRQF